MTLRRLSLLTVVFTLALVLRGGWVGVGWARHGATLTYPDETLHWEIARNLITHGALATDDGRYAARMPLYPLYLAAFAGLGDLGVLLARIGQALIGALGALIVAWWARRALGARAAWLAGGLAAIDPYGVFFCNLLLTEVLFTTLALGFAASAWRLIQPDEGARKATGWLIAAGALSSACLLTRPSCALWLPVVWLLIGLGAAHWRHGLTRLAICAGVTALLLLPWGLRNRAVLGHFAWLSANGGVTLYDALGPQARGDSDQSFLAQMPQLERMGEVERDRRLRDLALAEVRKDPARVARLAWTKFLRTWNPFPNVSAYASGLVAWVSAVFTIAVLALAAVGLWRPRRLARLHLIVWSPVVYFTLLHSVYIGSLRYRVPVMPFVEIAAGAAVASSSSSRAGEPPSESLPPKRR